MLAGKLLFCPGKLEMHSSTTAGCIYPPGTIHNSEALGCHGNKHKYLLMTSAIAFFVNLTLKKSNKKIKL